MLDKQGITFVAICDHCPEDYDTEEDEFYSAVEAMKREGWRVAKVQGQWDHTCPDCQENANDFEDVT